MKKEAILRFSSQIPKNFIDYSGRKIGLITVIKRLENDKYGTNYLLECECGTQFQTGISSLRRSKYSTCKCGYRHHSLKRILARMIDRCENIKSKSYKWYGGKGILVCEEWKKFPIKFIDWALKNGWQKGLSIDRIDSNGNYFPDNCQWISKKQNSSKAAKERWQKINLA